MRYYKQWMYQPEKLKKENLPIGWHEVTESEVIEKLDGNIFVDDKKTINEIINILLTEGQILKSVGACYIGVPETKEG